MTFRCWLPFPVSSNNLFAHGSVAGKVRRFPTKAYKAWRFEAVIRIKAVRPKATFAGPVACKIELTPADNRRRDPDNFNKAPLDALVLAGVLRDDSQIKKLNVEMLLPGPPGCVVTLTEIAAVQHRPEMNLRLEGAA